MVDYIEKSYEAIMDYDIDETKKIDRLNGFTKMVNKLDGQILDRTYEKLISTLGLRSSLTR